MLSTEAVNNGADHGSNDEEGAYANDRLYIELALVCLVGKQPDGHQQRHQNVEQSIHARSIGHRPDRAERGYRWVHSGPIRRPIVRA